MTYRDIRPAHKIMPEYRKRLPQAPQGRRFSYTIDQFHEEPKERYGQRSPVDYGFSREDILQEYEDYDWDRGEYRGEYEPVHEHDSYEQDYYSSYEHWLRSRHGGSRAVPVEWTNGYGDYEGKERRRIIGRTKRPPPPDYYGGDDYFAYAPEYYKERYMPEEDYLQRLYLLMFRNIDYDIKIPIMQIIATGALFLIFVINYMINYEYVIALSNFSPWVKIQPPGVAAVLGTICGIFLYLFPSLDRDLKRTVIIGTIILLIFFFAGPALWAGFASFDNAVVGQAFAVSLIEFLKLAAVLVYWAPIFIGVYGIWSRNTFYIGVSAMFLFLTIIILDIYLFYEGLPITKIRDHWMVYVVFSIILFCYIEMSDSAVTFAKLTSTSNQEEIDPSYYEHLDRILKKYFVYFILLIIFIIILTWLTLHFSTILTLAGSSQVAESLELSSIYGTIISLIMIGIVILLIGLFLRNEQSFKRVYDRLLSFFRPEEPQIYARAKAQSRRSKSTRYQTERERAY